MTIKALMVDVDGVFVVHPDPNGWSVNLERDLVLTASQLQEAFFKPHFSDIIHGCAGLHERLRPVLAEIAPHLNSEKLVSYWFEQDAHLDHDLLHQLAEVRSRGLELHFATVQEHERAAYLWKTQELQERFDAMHYAAYLGCAKPADEFYAKVEARVGYAPAEIVFHRRRCRQR